MTHAGNTTKKERPDWIRMWVGCAIFCGVSGAVYDVLKSVENSHSNPLMGFQAMVYTAVITAVFFLVRAVISKGNIKRAAFTLLGVCAAGYTLLHVADAMNAPLPQPGIAQTQEQL